MMMESIFAMDRARVEELKALMRLDPAALAEIKAKVEARAEVPGQRSEAGGVIAVIPISGFIEQRTSFFGALFGGTSTQRISAMFRASMADPAVKAIVFDVSSGGGSVFGVTELANEIMGARGSKPIVSVVNSMAASAAYWLAAAADEVVSSPSGVTGSVGVYAIHHDYSEADKQAGIKTEIISAGEHKADAVEGAPLSDAGRESMQAMVDHIYQTFVADLAAGRKVSADVVRADFGKGLLMTAPAAQKAGMIDRVATLDETLKRLSTPQGRAAVMRADSFAFASYKQGDRVRVKPGKHHDEMTKGKAGSVEEVSSAALGIKFDGMDKVHKWYTAEELDAESVNAYDGEAERRILRARVTV